MGIENRSNLDAAEEGKEYVDPKDPTDSALIVVLQLVLADVLMEDTDSIPILCEYTLLA